MKLTLRLYIPIFLLLLVTSFKARASHIYGADFSYAHVSGNTYAVTLVIYGDCNINPGATFLTLSTSSPEVEIYNGTTLVATTSLLIQAPSAGVEVTPVCASQLNNTTCNGGSVPGVKKFTYTRNVNLNTTSANWKFVFTGVLGGSVAAGRSGSITNVSNPPPNFSTTMMLEATLNNLSGPNSSPAYTTIPTPFFCINKAASYNPGTVDPNGDALGYDLVPGLDANTSSAVSYVTGLSATLPLVAATGTFNFSTFTGQLNFTPNAVQRGMVVNKISEFRGTTLVGTSMREMTFVVLNNCNNNAPKGTVSGVSGGTQVDTTTVKICKSGGVVNFSINPTDPDADVINVQASGLPAGATFNITNNNTTSPTAAFSWDVTNVIPGSYNFFVTYTDNGCPLSSKQTMAYTIVVMPNPGIGYALTSPATCSKKAKFTITPSSTDNTSPWTIQVLQGSVIIHSFPGVTGAQQDSLLPGTYTIRVINTNNCFKDTVITISAPPAIIPSVAMTKPTCFGGSDGSILLSGTGGLAPFQYAIGTGPFTSNNNFTGLTSGTYTMRIKDANDCIKDTIVILEDPTKITASIALTLPPCNFFSNGIINVTGLNGLAPYQYAMGSGSYGPSGTFNNLASGTYIIHIKDAKNCVLDTTIELKDLIKVHANAAVTHVLCNGNATGAITMTAFAATAPYKYQMGSGTLSATNTFTGLTAGSYNFHIEDVNRCYLDTVVTINEPTKLTSPAVVTHISCFGQVDGQISISGAGGVPGYTYALGAGSYGAVTNYTGLAKGNYTFHVKDANGCIKDTVITIIEPAVLRIASVTTTQPTCYGDANGSFTINATGGTTPYTYQVNTTPGFGPSNVIPNMFAGPFTLTVKDIRGCTKDTAVIMTEPTKVTVAAVTQKSVCNTLANGKVTLTGGGGVPNYTYAVGTGSYSPSPVLTPLSAGTYTFHVRDSRNCIKDTIINIADSLVLTSTTSVTDVSCFGRNNGSFTLTPAGGIHPFTYALGAGGSFGANNVFPNLSPGSYIVRFKDVNGCIKDTTINVTEPTRLEVFASTTEPLCFDARTGVVNMASAGGTAPYTFAIGSGAFGTSSTIGTLKAGTYTFFVKDARNCVKDTIITINQPAQLAFNLDITDILCFGESSGRVVVNASGGTPDYKYSFDNNMLQGSNVLTGIPAGTRAIHLTDANGCTKDTFLTFKVPPPFNLTAFSFKHPTCTETTDGSIAMEGKGGTSPYTYGYVNGPTFTTGQINGLKEGTYTFYIKDANGCTLDSIVSLKGVSDLSIGDVSVQNVSCFGLSDGSITVVGNGGTPPFKYRIDNSSFQTENTLKGLMKAAYTIQIADDLDCLLDTTIEVSQPAKLELAASVLSNNDCENADDGGRIAVEAIGGTGPYQYLWNTNPAKTLSDISGIGNGTYQVVVTDFNHCTDSASASIAYDNCCKVLIPDAFTPNNDGLNDKARLKFKGDIALQQFIIFNRFGQVVFKTTNATDGWDGTWKGVPQDLGTYNYYMKGICGTSGNKTVEYKGTIILVR